MRWLTVLPGAVLCGFLMTFPLHWSLYRTLSNFVEPYPTLPERVLSPLVIAAGLVWSGARIAPARKVETAVVLFGLWMMIVGGGVALTLFGVTVRGRQLFPYGGGLGPVAAIVGAIIGLLVVRHEAQTVSAHPAEQIQHDLIIKAMVEGARSR